MSGNVTGKVSEGQMLQNPKYAGIKPAATGALQREPRSRGLYARVFQASHHTSRMPFSFSNAWADVH
jgi:hypothetical protein